MRSAMPQSGKYLARKGRVRELHVSCFMARLHAANPRKFDDEGETLPLVRQSEHRFLKVRKRNEHVDDVPITRRVQARRATAGAFASHWQCALLSTVARRRRPRELDVGLLLPLFGGASWGGRGRGWQVGVTRHGREPTLTSDVPVTTE